MPSCWSELGEVHSDQLIPTDNKRGGSLGGSRGGGGGDGAEDGSAGALKQPGSRWQSASPTPPCLAELLRPLKHRLEVQINPTAAPHHLLASDFVAEAQTNALIFVNPAGPSACGSDLSSSLPPHLSLHFSEDEAIKLSGHCCWYKRLGGRELTI